MMHTIYSHSDLIILKLILVQVNRTVREIVKMVIVKHREHVPKSFKSTMDNGVEMTPAYELNGSLSGTT